MKKTLLLLSSALLFTWLSNAQAPQTIYSGVSVPTAQGWTELKLDATVNPVAAPTTQDATSGVLNLTSTNAADQFSQLAWFKNGLAMDLNTGFTLEVKAKVITADKTGAFNIQGFDKNGKGFRVGILADKVTEQTNPFAATNLIKDGLVNSDTYHIFTFTFQPSGVVTVFRDGLSIGTFPIQTFQYDNIIENGGFEDPEFPDFKSKGLMTRINKATDAAKVRNGDNSLELNNNGLVTDGWTNIEGAGTRQIAVKPNVKYESFITRRRTLSEPWCWRDLGLFYDTQNGTFNGVDNRNPNVTWGGFDRLWQTHPQDFTPPTDVKTIRYEFPTWIRDATKNQNTVSLDNVTIREKPTVPVGIAAVVKHGLPVPNPVFPASFVNLIANGDFENSLLGNDGNPYTWKKASDVASTTDNNPNEFVSMWGGLVRLQDQAKTDDAANGGMAGGWNHTPGGNQSLRWTTLDNAANVLDFKITLEPNKTYRFNFWLEVPQWGETGWLRAKINGTAANTDGGIDIWANDVIANDIRSLGWVNKDMVFTTTADNYVLHLYSMRSDRCCGWWNLYFDDFVLYEVNATQPVPVDPVIAGKTNLISNGNFEDVSLGNDGLPYTWALASGDRNTAGDNYPVAYNDNWGTYVRLQDVKKGDDTGPQWAHSGNKSLRISYLDNWDDAQRFAFGALNGAVQPGPYQTNINFKKDLEPNKTYTFVFWLKTADYPDNGRLAIANGDVRIWDENLSRRYNDWVRNEITFSTTFAHHTLRLFTEFGGWFNFYLDDLFLFEEPTYKPELAPTGTSDSYIQFGKSTGTSSTNVAVEYINLDVTGAFAPSTPTGTNNISTAPIVNVYSRNKELVVDALTPVTVSVYSTLGVLIENVRIEQSKSFNLPAGSYIIKSVSENGKTQSVKALVR